MGRRVYWAAVVLVVTTLRQQRAQGYSASKLKKLLDISHHTLLRWMAFFRDAFPQSPAWQKIRGKVAAIVRNEHLPEGLVLFFLESQPDEQSGLLACLHFLAVD